MLLSEIDKTEIGRALGADYARYGMKLPPNAPSAVVEGFAASAYSIHRAQPADRFIRKWIQLRMGALRRGRYVAPDVDADHVRAIDTALCPVTRGVLTHGVMADTDWSVDRLNNEGGYARGNLAVLSTRANHAKAAHGYKEVRRRSLLAQSCDGLSPAEWLRLACVMFGACHTDKNSGGEWLPQATWVPTHSTRSWQAAFQEVLLKGSRTAALRERIAQLLRPFSRDEGAHQMLCRVLKQLYLQSKDLQFPHDALLDSKVQADIRSWYGQLRPSMFAVLKQMVRELHGGQRLSREALGQWSLGTRGYMA